MTNKNDDLYIAFKDQERIAEGSLVDVALSVKKQIDRYKEATYLVFNQINSKVVDLDLRGSAKDIERRLLPEISTEEPKSSGPGRPKLGVISREISLLPRHWDWLATQTGGASVTLRKLVEDAKRKNQDHDKIRLAQDAVYKFMSAMAGDNPNYEEALRALYAKDKKKFKQLISKWPKDVCEHIQKLAKSALSD